MKLTLIKQLFFYLAKKTSWAFRCVKMKWVTIFCELLEKSRVIIEFETFHYGLGRPEPRCVL